MKATERQVVIAAALRVTLQQAQVIELLLANPIVTNQLLETVIPKHQKTVVHRMREKLKENSLIGARGRPIEMIYGVGYTLGPELRQTITDRIAQFSAIQPITTPEPFAPDVVTRLAAEVMAAEPDPPEGRLKELLDGEAA